MRTISIGTTPVLLSSQNPKRVRWIVEFTPVGIVVGNTGNLFIGRGFIPNAVLGDPNQGDVLNAGASLEERKNYETDPLPYKGNLWAVADTAGQQITYDEQVLGE